MCSRKLKSDKSHLNTIETNLEQSKDPDTLMANLKYCQLVEDFLKKINKGDAKEWFAENEILDADENPPNGQPIPM